MSSFIQKIIIQRGKQGLGFILSNQSPCVVSSVNQDGPADKAGLKTGDEIIEVNNIDVSKLRHDDVVRQILYDSPYVDITIRTIIKPNISQTDPQKQPGLFGSLDHVVKGVQRTTLIIGSPSSLKECELGNSKPLLSAETLTYQDLPVMDDRNTVQSLLDHKIKYLSKNNLNYNKDTLSKSYTQNMDGISDSENRKKTLLELSMNSQPFKLSNLFGIEDKSVHNLTLDMVSHSSVLLKTKTDSVYNAVVYYQCTVDIPKNSNIKTATLTALSNFVNKVQKTPKIATSMVLFTLSALGVTLSNPLGKVIVTYPVSTLVFSATCSDNPSYFGLVTKKMLSDDSSALSSYFSSPPAIPETRNVVLCSCHIFMVDTNLVCHDAHIGTSSLFDLTCSRSTEYDGCISFPSSALFVLEELDTICEVRKALSLNSSQSLDSSLLSLSPEITISNSLERVCVNSITNTTPKSQQKLTLSSPNPLVNRNETEKGNTVKEIQRNCLKKNGLISRSKDKEENSEFYQEKFRGNNGRRKSAPDPDICAQVSKEHETKKGSFISRTLLTNSLRTEQRKPPAPSRNSSISKNLNDLNHAKKDPTFLGGLKRTLRRKSEVASNSARSEKPKGSFKKQILTTKLATTATMKRFSKNSSWKRAMEYILLIPEKETPQSVARYEPRKDPNENLNRLSLSSASSELSLNDTTRVESWARSFEKLLCDAVGVKCFQEFLKKEFSEENVLFWVACERFKLNTNDDKMKINANEIYRNYLAAQSSFLVNVNQTAVKKVEESLTAPNSDMFSIAQDQVFQLMKFDSYNRFLKSDLYRECLLAENEDRLFPYEDEIDEELRKKPVWTKKNKSNLNNEKKGNLLNFLTKGRAIKTPEPESKCKDHRSTSIATMDGLNSNNGTIKSNGSGRTSKDAQLWDGADSKSKSTFIRVVLPDGHSTMVVVQPGVTIKQALTEICEDKKIILQTCDITIGFDKQTVSLDNELSTLSDNVVFIEKRVLFRFDLPNGRSVGIKANPSKTLQDVLQPVLKRNGFNIENFAVHVMNSKTVLPLDVGISSVENKRIFAKPLHKKIEKQNSDSLLGRHQDLRSSFRRFRTNSFKDDKNRTDRRGSLDPLEKERLTTTKKQYDETLSRKIGNEVKHLLLGRTRSADDDGASALMAVLQKSQSGRLDDQRGMISRDLELPDFLKVTANTPQTPRSTSVTTSTQRSSLSTHSSPAHSTSYPATPVISERFSECPHTSEESLDRTDISISLNSSLNSARPSICSVRSWKELSSPDRELIDKSFTSGESLNTNQSINTVQSIGTLTEISRSDPSLIKTNVKQAIYKENSAPLFSVSHTKNIDICLHANTECTTGQTVAMMPKRDRSRSFDVYDNNDLTRYRNNTLPFTRPRPINTFNEDDILRGLEIKEFEVISFDNDNALLSSPAITSGHIEPQNSLNLTTSTSANSHVKNTKKLSPKLSKRTKLLTEENAEPELIITNPRKVHTERIGSLDLVNYQFSPKAEAHFQDPFGEQTKNLKEDAVFKSNAIPTPEKSNLLKGETIRGRQNEKITFV